MEDNEFEEVTIISHTGEEPSDFTPRKALELLGGRISLEISQTVSEASSTKHRQLRDPIRPTYLDLVHETLFKRPRLDTILFISEDRREQAPRGFCKNPNMVIGTNQNALLFQPSTRSIVPLTAKGQGSVFYMYWWGEYLLEFRSEQRVKIFKDGVLVHQTKSVFDGVTNQHVKFTSNYLYFFNKNWWLIRMDRDFHEMVIVKKRIQDFEVGTCRKTQEELVTVLDEDGNVMRKNLSVRIEHLWDDGEFDTLKETYSSQYLVCEGDYDRRQSKIHLLKVSDLKLLDSIVLPGHSSEMTVALRLTAPKRGVGMFLLERDRSMFLGGIYRNKLYNISSVKLDFTIVWMAFVAGEWFIVGPEPRITSLAIQFT